MNLLVTGSRGQLGNELQELSLLSDYSNFKFYFSNSENLSLLDIEALQEFFKVNQINICINCAAYTAVDKAETEKENATLINVDAVRNLALVCEKNEALLVHISTDFVFDGTNNVPYKETDTTNPLSVYGSTKLEGEQQAQILCKNHIIIRTSWLYSHYGNNFVKTIQRLGRERDSLNIIFDQIGTPTYAYDLAKTILDILPMYQIQYAGVYHYSNEGCGSWFDFAYEILALSNISSKVQPIETTSYPTPAVRPKYSVLNKNKIKTSFNLQIPYWKESLRICLKKIS